MTLIEYKNELTKKKKKADLMVTLVNDVIQDIDEDIAADGQVDNGQANEVQEEDDTADINQAEDCNIEIAKDDLTVSEADNVDVDDMGDDKRAEVEPLKDEDHEIVLMSTISDRGEYFITDYGPQEEQKSTQ